MYSAMSTSYKGKMVGYVMVIYDYDVPEYDIWHMIIDESMQGCGYGSAALDQVIDYIKTKPFGTSNRVALTCNKNNTIARKLYESKGFLATGVEDEDEIEGEPENLIDSRRLNPFKTYILTNKEQYLGASVLFYNGVQDRIYDLLGECFMIPISVHRWLIIPITPYTKPKREEYERILKEDNRNAKYPELVLSDNVYMYDGELLMQV